MKVVVDSESCVACGACISIAPDIYDWDAEGKAKAISGDVPPEQEALAKEGLDSCPTEAIKEV